MRELLSHRGLAAQTNYVSYSVRAEVLKAGQVRNRWGSVFVRSCCEKLVAEAEYISGTIGRVISAVESRYQATVSEDCN
jgi:hypothetical protein